MNTYITNPYSSLASKDLLNLAIHPFYHSSLNIQWVSSSIPLNICSFLQIPCFYCGYLNTQSSINKIQSSHEIDQPSFTNYLDFDYYTQSDSYLKVQINNDLYNSLNIYRKDCIVKPMPNLFRLHCNCKNIDYYFNSNTQSNITNCCKSALDNSEYILTEISTNIKRNISNYFRNQIPSLFNNQESINTIQTIIDANQGQHLISIARLVSKKFKLQNRKGNYQITTCFKTLKNLILCKKIHGNFLEIDWNTEHNDRRARLLDSLPSIKHIPHHQSDIDKVKIVLVVGDYFQAIWNNLMTAYHPEGAHSIVGHQIRYIFINEYSEILGGCAFSSPGRNLKDRDQWVGWSHEKKVKMLDASVLMSRFVLRREVCSCKGLATSILNSCMNIIGENFKNLTNIEPLFVEAHIDTKYFNCGFLSRAKWRNIGETKGGKSIWVKELKENFRELLGIDKYRGKGAMNLEDAISLESLRVIEIYDLLHDKRNSKRLISIFEDLFEKPCGVYADAADGDNAKIAGYLRFLNNKNIDEKDIIEYTRINVIRLAQKYSRVFFIGDGSSINLDWKKTCHKFLKKIGKNKNSESYGLDLHTLIAVTPDGLVLGIVRINISSKNCEKSKCCKSQYRNIEDKESFCWIEDFREVTKIKKFLPNTQCIYMTDREGDFYELFSEQASHKEVDILIRAKNNRKLKHTNQKLFEKINKEPLIGCFTIDIDRSGSDPQRKRTAKLVLRCGCYEFIKTQHIQKTTEDVKLNVISAKEIHAKRGTKLINWYIITSLPIVNNCGCTGHLYALDNVCNYVKYYAVRWRIEDWHKILKSECGVEKIGCMTEKGIRNAIAIRVVVAWRIFFMSKIGESNPDIKIKDIYDNVKIMVINQIADEKGFDQPLNISEANLLIAKLGGYKYTGKENNTHYGPKVYIRGLKKFSERCCQARNDMKIINEIMKR